jgi:hypothetical protein
MDRLWWNGIYIAPNNFHLSICETIVVDENIIILTY